MHHTNGFGLAPGGSGDLLACQKKSGKIKSILCQDHDNIVNGRIRILATSLDTIATVYRREK